MMDVEPSEMGHHPSSQRRKLLNPSKRDGEFSERLETKGLVFFEPVAVSGETHSTVRSHGYVEGDEVLKA